MKRFLAIILVLTLIIPSYAVAEENTRSMSSEQLELISSEFEQKSEARLKYESLLAGDYRGYEMKEKFEELFGTGYTAQDILTDYEEIFDIGEGEIDEGFLQMITRDEINIEENLMEQSFSNNKKKNAADTFREYPKPVRVAPIDDELVETEDTADTLTAQVDVLNPII